MGNIPAKNIIKYFYVNCLDIIDCSLMYEDQKVCTLGKK
jgi:hypothetical protein